jgi:hypothetical protein
MNKYDGKRVGEFIDPVVRCDSCQELLLRKTIQEIGCCSKCGNRRLKNVRILQPEEMEQLKEWNVDPEFIAIFEQVENPQEFKIDPDTVPGVING